MKINCSVTTFSILLSLSICCEASHAQVESQPVFGKENEAIEFHDDLEIDDSTVKPRQSPSQYFSLSPNIAGPNLTVPSVVASDVSRIAPNHKVVCYEHHGFIHRRLYFEEPMLERCGQSKPEWRQVISSGAKFFTKGAALPLTTPFRRTYGFECSRY